MIVDGIERSREWLDAEYNVRAGIPDHEEIFARWVAESEQLRSAADVRSVGYGDHPKQAFDVYPPAAPTGADPLLVFVHGGYWQSLDKEMFGFLAAPYTARGICFASLDYRLAPEAGMDEIVADVRAGIAEITRRAPQFGADPGRIFVAGHSAGGHLAATAMATRWEDLGLPADLVTGACAISGLYDLEPIQACYLNEKLGMTRETARRNSPVRQRPAHVAPLILTFGGAESSEFARQQAELVRAWSAHEVPCQVVDQADGHHFDAVERLATDGPLREVVLAMIRGA
ncbi:arylformamidase [Saccharopolyspora shandongensis]|uniref:Arylformamidase n=1 Tax=Saccharopolyspora shandongensis TaxID=418495 RepID=A0A1H3DDJ8_9PSEU|nr:alpha/beta hydrolase [Saccharopolyspora shandongensis]SDX64582.1 arylformamidase [Saccharopolyspora shandongensis]